MSRFIVILALLLITYIVFVSMESTRAQTPELSLPAGQNGTDYSSNPSSLSGITLLATIPAVTTGSVRRGVIIQAQCAAGILIALDDPGGTIPPTTLILSGAPLDGAQGGALDLTGSPHTGRIRIFSVDPNCQMAARAW